MLIFLKSTQIGGFAHFVPGPLICKGNKSQQLRHRDVRPGLLVACLLKGAVGKQRG